MSPSTDLRIALVSREVYPFEGGGISYYVSSLARVLAGAAEVTIFSTRKHSAEYRRLADAGDPRIPEGVRFVFVETPSGDESDRFYGFFHAYSSRVLEALSRAYPDGGPDLVEFSDYHGEAGVSVQARRTADPRLRNAAVAVHTHTTSEICQILDGRLNPDFDYRAMFELERYAVRYADHLIWPGGDVLGSYRRYYGDDGVGPAVKIRNAFVAGDQPPLTPPPANASGRLRILYMGRLERRKGIYNLVRGLLALDRDDWELTILGGDTETGPLGSSVRELVDLTAARDDRIRFHDAVARERLASLIDAHHLCVVPSLWECWPNVALESLRRGRPVLATPTGGMTEIVQPGRSGWLSSGTGAESLAAAVGSILDSRDELDALSPSGPSEVFDELTDPGAIQDGYVDLARESRERGARGGVRSNGHPPLVTAVITYYELDAHIEETVRSFAEQTHPELEILIVNDGSFREADAVLDELADRYPGVSIVAQPNSGLAAARNFGVALARGRYVIPFDGDDVAEPELVERCLAALEANPDAAYVATWSRFMHPDGRLVDDGYQPLGNTSRLMAEQNVGGAAASLFRREVLERFPYNTELASYEDWYLFRQLRDAGVYGHVIPQRLFRYRVRPDSMLRTIGVPETERFLEEIETRIQEDRMEWVAPRVGS